MSLCVHINLVCLNPFEFIRKYRCEDCGEVMMCSCDESFGQRFLPHQLAKGCELETQRRIPVTGGFVPGICRPCRGLPEEAHPKAEMFGATSKIQRYYWREIYFRSTERFAKWAQTKGLSDTVLAQIEHQECFKRFEDEVIEEIKMEHQKCPKYQYEAKSADQVIRETNTEVMRLDAEYALNEKKGRSRIIFNDTFYSAEEFVAAHFHSQGFESLELESTPFHVIFSIYLWCLIQSPLDERLRITGFGDRLAFENKEPGGQIIMQLPDDFGTSGFAKRRAAAIEEHFSNLPTDRVEMLSLFDFWIEPSSDLRQYLWAHRHEDVVRARKVIEILPPDVLTRILRYLIEDYWSRYIGWPDLLLFSASNYLLVEVKSSGDKLREPQKSWIEDNNAILKLPFKIVKIHRKASVGRGKEK